MTSILRSLSVVSANHSMTSMLFPPFADVFRGLGDSMARDFLDFLPRPADVANPTPRTCETHSIEFVRVKHRPCNWANTAFATEEHCLLLSNFNISIMVVFQEFCKTNSPPIETPIMPTAISELR